MEVSLIKHEVFEESAWSALPPHTSGYSRHRVVLTRSSGFFFLLLCCRNLKEGCAKTIDRE